MERLDSFAPTRLLQRLHRTGDAVPALATFTGVVLFVDISNYTRLAESFCQQGAEGIERLGQILDKTFTDHVRAVNETGGDIACFAGDAFVAYWPADDDDVETAMGRARECARRLHAGTSSNPLPARATPEIAAPPLHIGAGSGRIWAARLGDADRSQLLLAGPAVRQAFAAASAAGAGETRFAFASTASSARPVSARTAAAAAQTAAAAAGLTGFLPSHVKRFVSGGYGAWLSQLRVVYALFVRIGGLDERDADALSRHQALVVALHDAIRPFAGACGTLTIDDKGLVFTLCLGMPNDTHADDALRAVRAALAIREALARLGLVTAAGVTAGGPAEDGKERQSLCMSLGAESRRQYWPVGRSMHLAGRLMEAAGHGVICTEEIASQVRHAVALSHEPPLTLKGVRESVAVYRVHGVLDERAPVLYGRERERALLDRHLDEQARGRGSVLRIVGDAGLGKTTLLHHLRQAAAQRGVKCLEGAAGSVEIDAGYSAWRPVFAALLADPQSAGSPASPPSSQEDRKARLGATKHAHLAPLVNAVLPGWLEDTAAVRGLSGQARADATSALLSEVLGAHATERFVLILEDCHWMDSASWRLTLRLAQDYRQALIVLTSRPAGDAKELETLRRLDRFSELELSALEPEAIGSLVEHVIGGRIADPAVIDDITRRSDGNPLFAREYALLLATQPRGHAAPADAGASGIRRLIASRLDTLPPSHNLAIKAASVIGDTFREELIARVYPGDPEREPLDEILASLAEHQLIVPGKGDGRGYGFEHALIREVAYQQLAGKGRRELHRRAAEAIQTVHEVDLRPHFATLAHHWALADVPASTILYADRAAAQALAAGAFAEADRLLSTCVEQARRETAPPEPRDPVRWHRQLADARHGMGQLEPRRDVAQEALRLAGARRPQSHGALLAHAMTCLVRLAARRALPPPRAPDGETRARALDVAMAYRHSGEVCYFSDDLIGMACDTLSAVVWASPCGPSPALFGASTELGGLLSVAGLRRIGERILKTAVARAETAGDQSAQAYAHMITCLYFVGVGDWAAAERSADRCQRLCEPMEDRVNWTNAQAMRFWMDFHRGRDVEAYAIACRLRDRAAETGNRQHRAWANRFLALCQMRRNRPDEATGLLRQGLDILSETRALNEIIPTRGILALAHLRTGDVAAAREHAAICLDDIARVKYPIGHSLLEGYSSLTTVVLDEWRQTRTPQARAALDRCLRVLKRYRRGFPIGEPRYSWHLGDYFRLRGRARAARACYRLGEAAAVRLGMPLDAARCRDALDALAAINERPSNRP